MVALSVASCRTSVARFACIVCVSPRTLCIVNIICIVRGYA
jgi:hypothetical protein